jgi:hypothetical protein
MYSDQTPMAYSEVKVFSPENAELEYQNSRTDANGWFAFVPNVTGEWSFATNDGMGHLSTGKLEIIFTDLEAATEIEATTPQTTSTATASATVATIPQPSAPAMASGGSTEPSVVRIGLGLSVILNILCLALLLKRTLLLKNIAKGA